MSESGTGQAREDLRRQLLDDDGVQDTEITLSTGKLLGIFFALVIVCSVFFTMGYLLGRSTANGSRTEIVGTVTTSGSSAGKPSAANKTPDAPSTVSSPSTQAGQQTTGNSAGSASSGQPASSSAPAEIKASPNGTYTVQVAAVSKKEDADILVSALLKKQYPAFSAGSASDALFHVQVGPFVDPKDAETMRTRLASDGYNAIVKH
ncbi:MAG TPA: SPOR domain-containing protein [Candidatus Angelobacter sp.]